MMNLNEAVLALLILQTKGDATPSTTKLESQYSVKIEDENLNESYRFPAEVKSKNDGEATNTHSQRQNRYYDDDNYNYERYGFPPLNPIQYPTYNKQDRPPGQGICDVNYPSSTLHQRLLEYAIISRQPVPGPPLFPTHSTLFYPFIFVQRNCPPNSLTLKPNTPRPITKPPIYGSSIPDITNRRPELNDDKQSQSLVNNHINDGEEDYSRPISFEIIEPKTKLLRRAPPVDHGSVQASVRSGTINSRPSPSNSGVQRLPSLTESAVTSTGFSPTNSAENRKGVSTTCESAVLSCCHRPHSIKKCLAAQGCSELALQEDPCDPRAILKIIKNQRL